MASERQPIKAQDVSPQATSFIGRHRGGLFMAGLLLYVVLLLIGTIGNLFEIDSITGFWLYR